MTEKDKFQQWFEREKAKGLVDMKLFAGEIKPGTTEEDLFRELNHINALLESGAEVERGDVF